MSQSWYYQQLGQTHGPFVTGEIKELARRGVLQPGDLVWLEGTDPKHALPAHAALDFARLPLVSSPAPDWLSDVEKVEQRGPLPELVFSHEIPHWLEDLRLWYGLELYVAVKTARLALPDAHPTWPLPDWLQGWFVPEKPNVSGDRKPVQPTLLHIPNPAATQLRPVAPVTRVPAQPVTPPAAPVPPTPPPPIPAGPGATPSSPEARIPPPVTPEDVLAEKTIQETGYDPRTGQILDPHKFRQWQKASHAQQPTVTNASLFEVFRQARTAIEQWVDDDSRRTFIVTGDLNTIKQDVSLLAIFQQFQGYGAAMQEKLMHHLEFMLENRKKYYTACSG